MRRSLTIVFVAISVALAGCEGGGRGGDGGIKIDPLWIDTGIATADIDGGGRIDVVTVAALYGGFGDSDGYLKIYRQQASGTFAADQYLVGRYPWRVPLKSYS